MIHMNDNGYVCDEVRIDKWLWAARLFKTRSLAAQAIDAGQVRINDTRIKPSRNVHIDDTVTVTRTSVTIELIVRQLSKTRGSATIAAALYGETPASIAARDALASARKEGGHQTGRRPTKRERRQMDEFVRG